MPLQISALFSSSPHLLAQKASKVSCKPPSFLHQLLKAIVLDYSLEHTHNIAYDHASQIIDIIPSFVISSIVAAMAELNKIDIVPIWFFNDFEGRQRFV